MEVVCIVVGSESAVKEEADMDPLVEESDLLQEVVISRILLTARIPVPKRVRIVLNFILLIDPHPDRYSFRSRKHGSRMNGRNQV